MRDSSRPALGIAKIVKVRFAARQMMWQNAREFEIPRGGASRPALDVIKIVKGRFAARQMMWQNARKFENQRSDMFAK